MKQRSHYVGNNRRPTFWVSGIIQSVYNNGLSALFEITDVVGKKNKEYKQKLAGLNVILEGENLRVASSLELLTEPYPLIKLGAPCGHQLVDEAQIAAKISYFAEEENEPNLGVRVIGWNHLVVFEPIYRQYSRLLRDERMAQEEAERRSETQKRLPYRIVYQGKVLVKQSLLTLADYFQYRAFPEGEGIVYEELVKGRFQPTSTPAMLAKPNDHGTGVTIGRPPNFPELDFLLEMVKDRPVVTSKVFDPEEEHIDQQEQQPEGLLSVGAALEKAASEKKQPPSDGKTLPFVAPENVGSKPGKLGKGKNRKSRLPRHEQLGRGDDDEETARVLAKAS